MGKKIELISDGIIEIEGVRWYNPREYIKFVGNAPSSTRTTSDHHRTGKCVRTTVMGLIYFRPSTSDELKKFKKDKNYTPLTEL